MSLALAGAGGVKGTLGRAYLGARGYADGCLAILGFEGEQARSLRRERATANRAPERWPAGRALARRGLAEGALRGAVPARRAADAGRDGRDARDGHAVVERRAPAPSRSAERSPSALRDCGTPGLVMCHVSHLYETGASLYFTFLARQREGEEIAQWQASRKPPAGRSSTGGGTITHHHAVGRDHAPWMQPRSAESGVRALRALKAELDPAGIMNPGKLIPG